MKTLISLLRRSFLFPVVLVAFSGLPTALPAQQEVGFLERFALAEDRREVLKELIPGTEDYYYFHALHFQTGRKREEFKRIMTEWKERFSKSDRRKVIENREALIRYSDEPEKTLAYLKRELGLNLDHRQEGRQRTEKHPSVLAPKESAWETFFAEAQSRNNLVEELERGGRYRFLQGKPKLDDIQRRKVLKALLTPDAPGLVELILADLGSQASKGFGEFSIHQVLTKAQLDELLAARPELKNNRAFVRSYLMRLRPGPDENMQVSPGVREAYLDRAVAFVATLGAPFNSLKVHLRYQRLVHDRALGQEDERRFLAYLSLPRNVSYTNPDWREKEPALWRHPANPGEDFRDLTTFPSANRAEEELVKDYLLKFLKDDRDVSKFAPYLRQDWLQAVFAEAKITQGVGEPSDWAALLSPSQFQALKDRVDIEFDATAQEVFAVNDEVSLPVHLKNVPKLVVKVFEINTLNYYRTRREEVSTDIDLDGLVANERKVYEDEVSPLLRVRRDLKITSIPKRRGLWVVELIGNGKSSRAVIRKGMLGVLSETTGRGRLVTVLDEKNQGLAGASVWLAGEKYDGNQSGQVLLPFSNDPGVRSVVVQDRDGFATMARIQQPRENDHLSAQMYLEQESLRTGGKAKLLVRPNLTVAGQSVSLGRLEKASLELSSINLDGTPATTLVEEVELSGDREFVHEFRVPDRVNRLTATLRATVKVASQGGQEVELTARETFSVNERLKTDRVADLYLSQIDGGYQVDFLGRNGEALANRNLQVTLHHAHFKNARSATLKTNEQGVVDLGALEEIAKIAVASADGVSRDWKLTGERRDQDRVVTVKAGETLKIPFVGELNRQNVALFLAAPEGYRSDEFARLRVVDGYLTAKLPAGDYWLHLKENSGAIEVMVVDGEVSLGHVFNEARRVKLPVRQPSHLSEVRVQGKALEIEVASVDPLVRVHVMATRFVPGFDPFRSLGGSQRGTPEAVGARFLPSLYLSGRKLGDELRYILERRDAVKFPGNMLERPGILLNPWAMRETDPGQENLEAGDRFKRKETGEPQPGSIADLARRRGDSEKSVDMSPSYEFLADPPVMLANLVPDEDGKITIDLAAFGDRQHLQVLLVDPDGATYRNLSLRDRETGFRDLRLLAKTLDPRRHFTEQEQVSHLDKGDTLVIPDLLSAQFEVYDDLGSVYRYFQALKKDETLREFSFVANWMGLSDEEKRARYSEFACHELSFFLSRKDPRFFKEVVRPYLANKRDRTFIDDYLLGEPLELYFEPYQYHRLNVVERILLAGRDPERMAALRLDLENRIALQTEDRSQQRKWFNAALGGGAFGDSYGQKLIEGLELKAEAAPAQEKQAAADPFAGEPAELPNAPRASNKLERKAATQAASRGRKPRYRPRPKADPFADKGGDAVVARQLYRGLEPTREWAENHYYQLDLEKQDQDLVTADMFWLDLARHGTGPGFGSGDLGEASGNFTEMMFALSFLDLPFEAPGHEEEITGGSLNFTAGGPVLLFHREVKEAGLAEDRPSLLVNQSYFALADPFRMEDGQKVDQFVTEEFVRGVPYGSRLVVTNPTSSVRRLEVLTQIPKGALAVKGQRATTTRAIELAPYSTRQLDFAFYFPGSGQFPIFPAHLSMAGQVVAQADPLVFKVVDEPSKIDQNSWAWVSQWGGEEEVLDFLKSGNLHALDLSKIAWRCRESAAFLDEVLAVLKFRGVYHPVLQGYAVRHNREEAISDLLKMEERFLEQCGLALACDLVIVDPVNRRRYQHLEYRPLINNRAHALGGENRILNPVVRGQYLEFLEVLSQQKALEANDHLEVTYYLFLQDRVAEALAHLGMVQAKKLKTQLQFDYFQAYAAMYQADLAKARKLTKKYEAYPVDRWRERFASLSGQLAELAGAQPGVVTDGDREQEQAVAAAQEPSLALTVEGTKVILEAENLEDVTVSYYEMDLEFLFSTNPFVSSDTSRFEMIRPNRSRTVKLAQGQRTTTFSLPEEFRASNVIVEVRGGGEKVSTAVFANELRVITSESMGLLTVRHDRTGEPLPKVYLKVYADTADGVEFFKDGYTDLRGKFDYASVSTQGLGQVRKFSILVMSEEHGATVLEARVPQR